MREHTRTGVLSSFLTILLVIFLTGAAWADINKKGPESETMTEAELQSQVMAFADRFISLISSGITPYKSQSPPPEEYKFVHSLTVYSFSSAFTVAAQASPVGALLDMVAMVTLGRIIFEENLLVKYGPALEPVIEVFRKAEKEIWQVAAKVLNTDQLRKMRSLIHQWRMNNPDIVFFPSVRFSDFSAVRGNLEEETSGGLFKSVEKATQQVEEVRLLAERGMYLGTRMPMLTGLFASVWFSQLANHPDMEKILKDVNKFSGVSERLAVVAEQLPDQIAAERDRTIKQAMENITKLMITAVEETEKKTMVMIDEAANRVSQERKAAIEQLMNEFSAERKQTIEDFLNEDQRVRGLLGELRQTLLVGNDLLLSVNTLTQTLDLGPKETQSDATAKPFEIKEYQATLKEASITIRQLHEMLKTVDQMDLDKALPQIVSAVETIEDRGEKWVFFAFFLGVALILVFLIGAVVASLVYRHFAHRIFRSEPLQAGS
ncbi:hypothetical protein [Desulfosarcina sp.]|uniref:hypothetical protein n=1 Tax=Desulfosarcina sp. TaxID=2027861 RepID=UPI0029BB7512|nr:hypothetical protein [Desulfosarcina sp.]MDX2452706.1 hypothetical protein [Desulfosarcina sp.]MDX2490460.1 hypothetical protein [Desulfosarcina sp.]